ncbi:hypothetical protein SCLCIDRAFT_1209216 [Scleroderma citrinum Foug A]|uniref:Uncharacterized protein n=1 Tax=Scleroderma citrinum Foug A TaxID=1036808 RepID=A0A0C3ATV5_9AGAM|nr:hypothetical protein SCLCIDRAFT_1209216 [Scleroderma citrinum Foug A]
MVFIVSLLGPSTHVMTSVRSSPSCGCSIIYVLLSHPLHPAELNSSDASNAFASIMSC